MKIRLLFTTVLTVFSVNILPAQISYSPNKGSLVLVGGDFKIATENFVNLAGGKEANIIYIPTAASSIRLPSGFIYEPSNSDTSTTNTHEFEKELCLLFGIRKITVLHTRNRAIANTKSFLEPLRKANGIWFGYGNAGRLADTYLNTAFQTELEAFLNRGGVIGGTSAGAIIQGSYIIRGRTDKPLLMAEGHEQGFGFLKNIVINPHLTEQKRENELVNVIDKYPYLLGIGLDEKSAIIVQGEQLEVIGEGRVAIYENKKFGNNWYYWLSPGDRFNLNNRTAYPMTKNKP